MLNMLCTIILGILKQEIMDALVVKKSPIIDEIKKPINQIDNTNGKFPFIG